MMRENKTTPYNYTAACNRHGLYLNVILHVPHLTVLLKFARASFIGDAALARANRPSVLAQGWTLL